MSGECQPGLHKSLDSNLFPGKQKKKSKNSFWRHCIALSSACAFHNHKCGYSGSGMHRVPSSSTGIMFRSAYIEKKRKKSCIITHRSVILPTQEARQGGCEFKARQKEGVTLLWLFSTNCSCTTTANVGRIHSFVVTGSMNRWTLWVVMLGTWGH